MTPRRGCFVTIEGVEGVGKSTNIAFMEQYLAAAGIPFVSTREPGGTPLGEQVRTLLLRPGDTPMAPMTELLLMFAARAEHVERVIRPALAGGRWVLCDRFTDSSYAYQGAGRGIPAETIAAIEAASLGGMVPDATLILDLAVSEGLARAERVGAKDRFERESGDFFTRVRAGFLARAGQSGRYRVIDAGATLAEVQRQVAAWLDTLVADWRGDGAVPPP